jgi:hypothetical protein
MITRETPIFLSFIRFYTIREHDTEFISPNPDKPEQCLK